MLPVSKGNFVFIEGVIYFMFGVIGSYPELKGVIWSYRELTDV
jgi:hypothetical protein